MKYTALLIIICSSILTACTTLGLDGPTATATVNAEATAAVEAEQALSTQNAEATVDAASATVAADATIAALTAEAATPTLRTLNIKQTEEANEAFGILQNLYENEFISTTEGTYLPLNAFSDSHAEINQYDWSFTNYSPANFVFRSDIEWESASDTANWFNSGCGIVFRAGRLGGRFLIASLNLDGSVDLRAFENSHWRNVTNKQYGNVDVPNGGAELLVTAEGEHILVFVNSKLVVDVNDSFHKAGDIGFVVNSGTNADYGTRCIFRNIVLWELDNTN